MKSKTFSNFTEARQILDQFIENTTNFDLIENGISLMADALRDNKKIISCGNGGSMSDAMHFAEELSGRFKNDRKALAAVSISDPTHISCVGNDYGYQYIFSRYVEALGQKGDVLLAISTSGNSENVVNAAKAAKEKEMKVIALTGKDGGKLAYLADIEIRAPKSDYADRAQEIHIKIIHSFIEGIEMALNLAK